MMRRQLGRHTGALTGEVSKIVHCLELPHLVGRGDSGRGLKVGLKEVVAMGGVKVDGAGRKTQPPVYGTVTIGPDNR